MAELVRVTRAMARAAVASPPSAAGTIEVLATAARCVEPALNLFQGQVPAFEGGLETQINTGFENVRLPDATGSPTADNSHARSNVTLTWQFAAHNPSKQAW